MNEKHATLRAGLAPWGITLLRMKGGAFHYWIGRTGGGSGTGKPDSLPPAQGQTGTKTRRRGQRKRQGIQFRHSLQSNFCIVLFCF